MKEPATLSFHLRELMGAGLVAQERSRRNLVYRADCARMNDLLAYLTGNCRQGVACAASTGDAAHRSAPSRTTKSPEPP